MGVIGMRVNANPVDYKKLGERIREIREAQRMRQALLAEKIGSTGSHVSGIENASTKVSLPILISIANALHCSMDDLLRDSIEIVTESQKSEAVAILSDCSGAESEMLLQQMKTTKQYVRQYLEKASNDGWDG